MLFKACAIRDLAVEAFNVPFFVPALGAAVRSFQDEVNKAGTALNAHPEDYDLFHLGDYDDSIGRFIPLDIPKSIAIGKEVLAQP